jgi:heat shock protein HslJ
MVGWLAALALVILLLACGGPTGAVSPIPTEAIDVTCDEAMDLAGTAWILSSLYDSDLLPGTNITLEFAEGRASGFAGCNAYGGPYTATATGALEIPVLELTAQLCEGPPGVMEQEEAYTEAWQNGAAYRVVGDRLEIDDATGETTLVFVRRQKYPMDPGDLVDTAWRLVSTNGQPPVEGSTITLVFDDNSHASGHAGCRDYTVTYEADGDDIRFPFQSMEGDDACLDQDALYRQEGTYTDALTWATNYRLDDGRFELFTARGEVLLFEPLR